MPAPRTKFGEYELVRTLGVGGMAQTWKAFRVIRVGNDEIQRPVCLKQVLPIYNQDEDFLRLFHREAKLAAQLHHTNIVQVHNFGEVEGKCFMELELVDGLDLAAVLKAERTLPSDVIKLLGLKVAAALDYAHNRLPEDTVDALTPGRRGIIHRDISPSNILISRQGDIKLADFGIAKALSGSATAKASRSPLGKLPYMAPERFNQELPTDGRADLFSLGVVLFECAAGRRPYDGEDDAALVGSLIRGISLRLDDEAPDLEDRLRDTIHGLLESDLDKRTPTSRALTEQLFEIAPSARAQSVLAGIVQRHMPPDTGPTPELLRIVDLGEQRHTEGDPVSLQLVTKGKKLGPLTYGATGLPEGLWIDATTGQIGGVIAVGAAGTHEVVATVDDGISRPTKRFTWTVRGARRSTAPTPSDPGGLLSLFKRHLTRRNVLAALGVLLLTVTTMELIRRSMEPSAPLAIVDPGPQTNTDGDLVSLQIVAKNTGSEPLRYSADAIPQGLSTNAETGLISGTVARAAVGDHTVSVTVHDGNRSVGARFVWTIHARPPPDAGPPDASVLDPPPPPTRGYLRVVVIPWGNAWVDGKRYRPGANGYMRVPSGTRVVKAGRGDSPGEATLRRTKRVPGGQKKSIRMDLSK